ncbi:MAG: division plane positioning ATPase MipZ [Lactobacillaceae bacterium]|jgi:chromosome partitioning protein|nr:division plane positioning ATPase MipZ [Lactobacillaceae bacterium]
MSENRTKKAHIIVVSNEKGGTGKSTISMHLATLLLYEGYNVATIDMDGRQGTFTKYIENRKKYNQKSYINLPISYHLSFSIDDEDGSNPELIGRHIKDLAKKYDAIIIDTPGTKNYLFDEAHKYADTLITPISDSLLDLNVMADIDFNTKKIGKPGHYANHIWDVKKYLAARNKPYLNWVVAGNRISSFNSKNKTKVMEYLERLSKLYGFKLFFGIKDRAIYKELFLDGLTILDMNNDRLKMKMSISHIAAKREIRKLAELISADSGE